jgi:hypothetical protein
VYRKLAEDLLQHCRPLPLSGFQQIGTLPTRQLIRSVTKACHFNAAWRRRAPRPIRPPGASYSRPNDYMLNESQPYKYRDWYKTISSPPGEDVDWLSPITSKYTLCATKSGKVVCWSVGSNSPLATWDAGYRWELWKCRVEFEESTVYFTMAKVLQGSYVCLLLE